MIEMKHYRLLAAIEQAGSLSVAAKIVGYSQPAVTQQVQLIERLVQAPVIIRSRQGIRFTEAGEVLLRHGRQILASAALAEAEVDAIAGLRSGRVRLACFPSAAATVLPGALAEMRSSFPGIRFTLVEAEPQRSLNLLRSGECDLAIVYEWVVAGAGPSSPLALLPEERSFTLIEDSLHLALPSDHPQANARWVDLRDLVGEVWVAGCPVCRTNLLDLHAPLGVEPEIGFETDDHIALQGLVVAGLGVALVTDLMLIASHRHFDLTLRPLAPMVKRVVSVVSTGPLLRVPGVEDTVHALQSAARAAQEEIQGAEL